jgi:hypothetical protein
MAMDYLLAAARNLSGHNIGTPEEKKFCSFNGFMVEAFVNQSEISVLSSPVIEAWLTSS